jgi:hypothetical protein
MTRLGSIDEIFRKDKNRKYGSNALLGQYILRYSQLVDRKDSGYSKPFPHRDLANWLVKNYPQYREYYQYPPHSHTSISNRIENTTQRTKGLLNEMISLGLIERAGIEPMKTGTGTKEIFRYTYAAYFVLDLINISNPEQYSKESDKILALDNALNDILAIGNALNNIKNSYTIEFLNRFFLKCTEKKKLRPIINYFVEVILPTVRINKGTDLFRIFYGLSDALNWLLAEPSVFLEVLEEIGQEIKKVLLFQFKMEIENYYDKNYRYDELKVAKLNNSHDVVYRLHSNRHYFDFIPIPGKIWQLMRLHNIGDYSKVVVPANCDKCRSESTFLIDISQYLENFRHCRRSDFSGVIGGNCSNNCGTYIVGKLMNFPFFNVTVPWTSADISRFL